MSKFKVAFNLDLAQIAPETLMQLGSKDVPLKTVSDVVATMLLGQARKSAKDKLHSIRLDSNIDPDVKIIKMSEQIRNMMITLMAESNMSVERLDDSVEIYTELPFERNYNDSHLIAA